jgi:hypothetical protein
MSPAVHAEWLWFRGYARLLSGDPDEAVDGRADLQEGIARLDEFGARGMAAQAREDLGRWLVDQGSSAEAEPLLTAARATYEEIGATGWLASLDAWENQRERV